MDRDDFYFTTLDLVLFNFTKESPLQVSNSNEYGQFETALNAGALQEKIYLVDEFFFEEIDKMRGMLESIKKLDSKAIIISYSVSNADELENKDLYDHFVLKSGKSNDLSLIKTLSEILGVDFVANNSDPEYEIG